MEHGILINVQTPQSHFLISNFLLWPLRGEWPSGLYSLCQVTEVKLG